MGKTLYFKKHWPCACGSGKNFGDCCSYDPKASEGFNLLLNFLDTCNDQANKLGKTELWNSHRENVMKIIENINSTIEKPHKSSVAILGAGYCRDIPLDILAKNYKSIDLFDFDWKAIIYAKNSLPKKLSKKINCHCIDLTGLFYRLVPSIIAAIRTNQFNKITDYISNNFQIPTIDLPSNKKYDLILSINVVSQLFKPFFDCFIDSLQHGGLLKPDTSVNKLIDTVGNIAHNNLPEYHLKLIKNIAKPYAKILLTTDKFEWGKNSYDIASPVNNYIDKPEQMLDKETQKILTSKGYQICGSTIDIYINNFFIKEEEKQWLWYFNNNRVYLVDGYLLTPKN